MKLNEEQISLIEGCLEQSGIGFEPFKTELIDDIATRIEMDMENGRSFGQAFEQVMLTIPLNQLPDIQEQVMTQVKYHPDLINFERKQTVFLTLALCGWVGLEYFIGRLTGIKELGPLYGNFSLLIMATLLIYSLHRIRYRFFDFFFSPSLLIRSGLRIILISTLAFASFLFFFWTYIHPDFYLSYQMEEVMGVSQNEMILNSLIGTAGGCIIYGISILALIGFFYFQKRPDGFQATVSVHLPNQIGK